MKKIKLSKSMLTVIGLFALCFSYNKKSSLNINCLCPSPNINFKTQLQIDNFPIQFPRCTEIQGNIKISSHNIKNLDGLSQIAYVKGFLHIYKNDLLKNLNGLSQISAIDGDLLIRKIRN